MSDVHWSNINSFTGNFTSKSLGYYRPCPICGSLNSKKVLELKNFQFYSDSIDEPKRFNVSEVVCLTCFALYLNPCYSKYGFGVLFAEAGQSYGSTSEHTQKQIKWLKNHDLINDGAIVLDIGCYEGYFLSCLPDNLKKLGVDIDLPAIERGRQLYKEKSIQYFCEDFESFSYRGPAPDTITMFHVLEHLPRPVEVLKRLKSISDRTTNLVIEVPIIENGKTNDINGFFSIQHATHFSKNSLNNCLEMAGWKIIKEYKTTDYNGYRVLATPELEASFDYSKDCIQKDWINLNAILATWYSAIGDVEKIIQTIPNYDRFVIWGGGAHTEFLYQVTSIFHTNRKKEFVIVDSDHTKHGKTWRGIPIYNSSTIKGLNWSSTSLLISSYGGQDDIFDAAGKLNVPPANITRFYKKITRY